MRLRGQRKASASPEARVTRVPARGRDWGRLLGRLSKMAATPAAGIEHSIDEALRLVADAFDARWTILAHREGEQLRCVALHGGEGLGFGTGDLVPAELWDRSPSAPRRLASTVRRRPPELPAMITAQAGIRDVVVAPTGDGKVAPGMLLLCYSASRSLSETEAAVLDGCAQILGSMLQAARRPPFSANHPQLEHSQKMEALGSMAGMIAHDFNNLLTTILGYTSLMKNNEAIPPEDRGYLDQMEEAAHRAADLTARLLAFARGGLMRTGPLDLRSVTADTLRLAEPALHNRVDLVVDLPAEPVAVNGDEGQVQQAILNILLNARDAMPDGGRVMLSLAVEGPNAVLTIADKGPGMTPDILERIYDPFFTTKPPGSGTGLGLSITYGIVRAHRGDIAIETKPGRGTSFRLRFPILDSIPAGDDMAKMAAADRDLVLVVDDDDMVRRTTMATVAHLGYNVVDAPSGRIAVDLVRARPERFAVVLLDLVMPELTGAQTFKLLREIRADLPVVVCTGYAADSHLDDGVRAQIAGLIHKPFTPERVAKELEALGVRRARDRSPAG